MRDALSVLKPDNTSVVLHPCPEELEKPVWMVLEKSHLQKQKAQLDRQFAQTVAICAQRALTAEVCFAPKPGLVDRLNRGAHRDMDLYLYLDSACALGPHFQEITALSISYHGEEERLLEALRYQGILAEEAMMRATGGVNTHRGAIFALGLVCAAAGRLHRQGQPLSGRALLFRCGRIAASCLEELDRPDHRPSHGREAFARYGLPGARGESCLGYPHVQQVALPALRSYLKRGHSLEEAGVMVLLHLMACVDDTNIVHRSDLDTLRRIQGDVRHLLERGLPVKQMMLEASVLDDELSALSVSPGGCADLLAVTLLVHFLTDAFPEN